jgi:hypothetical protein
MVPSKKRKRRKSPEQKGDMSMQVMSQRCAGIDVHLRFLVVCLIIIEAGQRRKEIRTFRNETADLLALRAWLVQEKCTHVGMERTGVYWMPVYRRLEGFFELVVANAQHIKGVPGRKTSVRGQESALGRQESAGKRRETDGVDKGIAMCGRRWCKRLMGFAARIRT